VVFRATHVSTEKKESTGEKLKREAGFKVHGPKNPLKTPRKEEKLYHTILLVSARSESA